MNEEIHPNQHAEADDKSAISFGQLLALGPAAFVIFSISYNYGFFRVVGPEFMTLLSIADHISTGITVLPATVAAAFTGVCYGIASSDEPKTAKHKGLISNLKNLSPVPGFMIFLFFSLALVDFGFPFLFVALAIFWPGVAVYLVRNYLDSQLSKSVAMILVLGPLLCLIVAYAGAATATSKVQDHAVVWKIRTIDQNTVEAPLVLNIERGSIIYLDSEFRLIPASQISEIIGPKRDMGRRTIHDWFKRLFAVDETEHSHKDSNNTDQPSLK